MSFTSTILPVSMRGYRRCFYIIPLKKLQEVTACKLSACICHQHIWWPGPLEPTFCYALDCMLCRTAGCRSCHMKVCCLVQDVVKVKGLTPFTGPRYPINKYLIIEIQLMLEGTWSGNFGMLMAAQVSHFMSKTACVISGRTPCILSTALSCSGLGWHRF